MDMKTENNTEFQTWLDRRYEATISIGGRELPLNMSRAVDSYLQFYIRSRSWDCGDGFANSGDLQIVFTTETCENAFGIHMTITGDRFVIQTKYVWGMDNSGLERAYSDLYDLFNHTGNGWLNRGSLQTACGFNALTLAIYLMDNPQMENAKVIAGVEACTGGKRMFMQR